MNHGKRFPLTVNSDRCILNIEVDFLNVAQDPVIWSGKESSLKKFNVVIRAFKFAPAQIEASMSLDKPEKTPGVLMGRGSDTLVWLAVVQPPTYKIKTSRPQPMRIGDN